jgi:hypothetical protein
VCARARQLQRIMKGSKRGFSHNPLHPLRVRLVLLGVVVVVLQTLVAMVVRPPVLELFICGAGEEWQVEEWGSGAVGQRGRGAAPQWNLTVITILVVNTRNK